MSINAYPSTFIFSILISVFSWFSMKVIVTWLFVLPAWVILQLSKGVFSYNFGLENLMVQSVFNEHQCMFINFHLFSIDQCVFLIFHESNSYLRFFVPAWVILKLSKGVFSYNFGIKNGMVYSVINEHQCMFINFHLFSIDQCVFLIFHESYSYLMIFCASMSDIKNIKSSVFIQLGYENLMVQSVLNVHQCMFINFYLFSIDQCAFLIFHESYSFLMIFCASMSDIKIMKSSVFIQLWYGAFNGAICF